MYVLYHGRAHHRHRKDRIALMSAFTLRFVIGEGLLYSVATLHTLSTRKADTNTGRNVFISLFILVFKDRSIALSQNLAVTENCKQGILA